MIKKWALELERHFSKEEMQLANRPMKICLVSLIIRKMQIETAKRYHLTPVRIAIIKNPTKTNVSEDVEKRGTLIHCCWGYKFVQPLGKQYGGFQKIKKRTTGDPFVVQWLKNPTRIDEDSASILGLLSGLRILHCHELWCRSQMQLKCGVAMAVV